MSNQEGQNLKPCKDCAANNVTTMVLWMQNPANPAKRMPADYVTLQKTGQAVAHKCPYWKKTNNAGTAPPPIADARMTQTPPLPQGQATLPTGGSMTHFMGLNEQSTSILTNMVLAIQEVSDKLGTMNEYLQILANREVKQHPGIKSALQAKGEESQKHFEIAQQGFNPQWCDHDEMGTINDETGICTNCGTSFPAFIKEQEQEEFPDEDQLEETETSRRNRLQRDPDAFPPL